MKPPFRYWFPALFGIMIYGSIRLVNDTMVGEPFWERSLRQNSIEVVFVLLMAYTYDWILRSFVGRFNRRRASVRLRDLLLEYGTVLGVCLLLINPVLFLIHALTGDPTDTADVVQANVLVGLFTLLYYAIARGNRLIHSYIEQQTQLERIKAEGLQTELKFLKAQYHPHFLFNALNTIYFQMDESVEDAKRTVERFSELLRYQLYDQQQLVPLERELQHLQNFVYLHRQRASGKLQLEVRLDEALRGEKIYPLLLLPLVENAFKYVGGDYRLSIEAGKEGPWIHFRVQNSVPPQPATSSAPGGIGLENLQRRLELLYPGEHVLKTYREGSSFIAELKIKSR